jgi:hypothetical protein
MRQDSAAHLDPTATPLSGTASLARVVPQRAPYAIRVNADAGMTW